MYDQLEFVYSMDLNVTFVISKLTEEEATSLNEDHTIITKMLLSPDDYKLFRYKEGELIQVQTQNGNRIWCEILKLEIVEHPERVILIFTLEKAMSPVDKKPNH